ncbi:MAG: alpha/beta hydrolase, partial [Alphaproteobacteria bacterium]
AAVILEAPFTSVADVAAAINWYVPVRHLVLDKFDSVAKVAAIGCPLLILHGERDDVIPARFGRALIQRAREPKVLWLAPGADHVDLYDHGAADAVAAFLRCWQPVETLPGFSARIPPASGSSS